MRSTKDGIRTGCGRVALAVFGLITAAFVLAACGGDEPTPQPTLTSAPTALGASPTEAKAAWEVEWEETLAKAQEEGELVAALAGGASRTHLPIYKEFERKFGIKTVVATGRGRDQGNRIMAERSAGKYLMDLTSLGGGTTNSVLKDGGALSPVEQHLFLPDVIDTSNWFQERLWWGDAEQQYILMFAGAAAPADTSMAWNTSVTGEDFHEKIGSLWDIIDPEWKGQVVAIPPIRQVLGSYYETIVHPELGEAFIRSFFEEMEPTFVDDNRTIVDGIAQGKFAYGAFLGAAQRDLKSLREEGIPISTFDIERKTLSERPTIGGSSSANMISIVDQAKNPNAAKLYLNWFLSKEGQTFYHEHSDGTPEPSYREDVPPGKTIEFERRKPGVEYLGLSLDPNFLEQRPEAERTSQRIFEEVTGRDLGAETVQR